MLTSMSPREDKFFPLPWPTYSTTFFSAVTAYALREVVVCDVLVVALDLLECHVSKLLDSVGDLDEHALLLSRESLTRTISDSLSLSLTLLDGSNDGFLHHGVHGIVLLPDQVTILLTPH